MNAAERKRLSRARQKEDPDKRKFLEKEKEKSRKRRIKAKKTKTKKYLFREKERLKKQRQSNKMKAAKTVDVDESAPPMDSYKTKRTLNKTINKVIRAMPTSPNFKKNVVKQLAIKILPSLSLKSVTDSKESRSNVISKKDEEVVRKYYELDEISRAAPGRKDTISIKDPITGKRTHVTKRHMTMSVAEAYQLFKQDYPNIKIGKFFEFRPVHVKTMPHNVCV
ncbi:hypothetical protein O0L34_g3557 [Tuta absoluta]|nr:hypothetical protein O0L34_g3557 [Tuta absoluta]